MTQFYFGDSETSSENDDDDLPFPAPLQRSSFLTPTFSPSEYLASLHPQTRHQTLEDLRSELRERSSSLQTELLELVNSNYQDFLDLGGSLKGGDEKVEEVRVGLLSFEKEIGRVKNGVTERAEMVNSLIKERNELRKGIDMARGLVEINTRLEELEGNLMVEPVGKKAHGGWVDLEDDSEDENSPDAADGTSFNSTARLKRFVRQYILLKSLIVKMGSNHPFLRAQERRMNRLRNTIYLDLENALQNSKADADMGPPRLIKILALYSEMGNECEAIRILKELKSKGLKK
ncbi:MAG: hypothetical protein M1829_003274 [Trizodia sp. TS-e1964]|nr:MAG: hypothetical protein M1829_003274 [Trizodia sp. TS-e1964]